MPRKPKPPPVVEPIAGAFIVRASAESYSGDPAFILKADGHQIGGTNYVSAQYAAGAWQDVVIPTSLTSVSNVEINYVNDAYGGSGPGQDRNLFIDRVMLDTPTGVKIVEAEAGVIQTGVGMSYDGVVELWSNGLLTVNFTGVEPTPDPGPTPTPKALTYEGVNLAGGEFDTYSTSWHPDGDYYTYPTNSEIDYFAAKGMNTIRMPFKAVRVLTGDYADDIAAMHRVVDYAKSKGVSVVLDMHDYGRTHTGKLIGVDSGANAEFAADWLKLATEFKASLNVLFGLMNEPYEQSTPAWLTGANAAIAAIRSSGATQKILVPGGRWTGAHDWVDPNRYWSENSVVMPGTVDPLNNFAFEVHQYLDPGYQGDEDAVIPGVGATVLKAVTDWARTNHFELFLGEFGFAETPAAMKEGKALNDFTHANRDVWCGQTFWAAGPYWGASPRIIEPYGFQNGEPVGPVTDRPQVSVLDDYLSIV